MELLKTFIYCPCSGDRVFAWNPTDRIVIVRWGDRCRTVLGGGRLEIPASEPGNWCRKDARRLAAQAVCAIGGIAWDDQGVVNIVAPRKGLGELVADLKLFLPNLPRNSLRRNLWRGGWTKWTLWHPGETDKQIWYEEEEDPPLRVREVKGDENRFWGVGVEVEDDTSASCVISRRMKGEEGEEEENIRYWRGDLESPSFNRKTEGEDNEENS